MNCDAVLEATGSYALRALPFEEMREVDAHLRECDLHEEMASLRAPAMLLAYAPEEREPPAALKARIMAAITEEDRAVPVPIPLPVTYRQPRGIRPAYALAAVFALLALGMLIWNVTLLREDEPRQVFVPLPPATITGTVESELVRRVVEGPGTGTVLRHLPDQAVTILEVIGLDQIESGFTYQIWTLRGKDVASAGTFMLNPDGTARVAFSSPLNLGDQVAITVEPAGGSPAPTSEPLVVIKL
jgi:hypothetical protein